MNSKSSVINNTVSISLFNCGMAGKVFDEVKKAGTMIVMENDTPECVLMAPDEYVRLMDVVNDARLLALAVSRMEHFDPKKLIPAEDVYGEFGITPEDLADFDKAELE